MCGGKKKHFSSFSSAKIENICRLCLSGDDDNLESIFGDSGSELLQMIIYDCTSVKVRIGGCVAKWMFSRCRDVAKENVYDTLSC